MVDIRIHAIISVPVAYISWVLYPPHNALSIEYFVFLCTIFFGFIMDFDHISGMKYIKGLMKKDLEVPTPEEWTNWLHTKKTLVCVMLLTIGVGNLMPLLSYAIHIGVDGFNRANLKYANSPMPVAIVKWLLRNHMWTYWFSETREPDDVKDYSILIYT